MWDSCKWNKLVFDCINMIVDIIQQSIIIYDIFNDFPSQLIIQYHIYKW